MALFSVTVTTASTPVASIPPGARKIVISNPAVNAQTVALKLDMSATALTFATGIQLAAGANLVIDLDMKECPIQVVGIVAATTAVIHVQTLGTGI
jgi:hypothetical protein